MFWLRNKKIFFSYTLLFGDLGQKASSLFVIALVFIFGFLTILISNFSEVIYDTFYINSSLKSTF